MPELSPRDYWDAYVERCGGLPALAEASGIGYSTLAGVSNGFRGIGRDLANRLVDFDPLLDKGVLLQIEPTRGTDAAA